MLHLIPTWAGYILASVFGLALGSYLNSWMWRVRDGRRQQGNRSQCVHCNRALAWFENIPLISFLALRGKCRTCHGAIPADYFLVELALGLGFLGLAYYHISAPALIPVKFFRDVFFFALLAVIFVYDLKYQLILSGVIWSGTVIAFVINYYSLLATPYSLLLGMAVGGGFFLLQYLVSRGRWIGGGDVRLGVMMGALVGWPNILMALFLSYVGGALAMLPLLAMRKKGLQSAIPFGTFLAAGTLLAMLFGSAAIQWYSNLVGW